ncbi:MAG TPA: alpha-galactosidase [Roseiflexaceae bacterium]|nr:alpha-galactosidase [Roseiflexaceae bacterium]HMP39406.1 alpha-galactosidase [Roseiflexaceae bacterium]
MQIETSAAGWRLQSTGLAVTLTFADGRLAWQLAADGVATQPAALSELHIDGVPVVWQACEPAGISSGEAGEQILTLRLQAHDGALTLQQYAAIFPGMPFVRLWGELTSSSVVQVSACCFLSLRATGAPSNLFHVEQFSWNYRHDFFTPQQLHLEIGRRPHDIFMGSYPSHHWGPTSCAWIALRPATPYWHEHDIAGGPGLVAGLEFNGKSRLQAWAEPQATHIRSTIEELDHRLVPGQNFTIPPCFVGTYTGNWDEAGYVTQRFSEAFISPAMPDDRYPWAQYNSWKYEREINEAQQMDVIEHCAELGIELVVLDLGWARNIGDWRPDPAKFPRGLKPLVERAHSHGMRFGVHMALPQCNVAAPVAQAHPEWLIHPEVDDYWGAAALCLAHEPARDWLTGEILRLIDEEQIDYIIQDAEDLVKRCTRSDHSHAPGDSNYSGSERGIDVIMQTIRRERPHVVLENCEDGGCMMTYKMARLYHTSITVDNIASYATRQGIYGASYPFSPRYSVRYMQDDPTPYTLRSSIFGGPLILMQRITDWNDEQMALTKAAVAEYKALRGLIRDAKIIHLDPPRSNVEYVGYGWDAIQAVAPERDRSVVFVFRALGGKPEHTVRPRGLDDDARYRVHLSDANRSSEQSGAELARHGVTIALGEEASEIITIERV